jgi:hypothetical protein
LRAAVPAPGSTVSGSPSEIRLTFDEPLVAGSTFVVYASAFQSTPGVAPVIEGASLHAHLASPLAPGDYTVQWKAVTADGHTTEGSYRFRVQPPTGAPPWAWGVGLVVALAAGGAVLWRRRGAARTGR